MTYFPYQTRLLGTLKTANLNSTSDQVIAISSPRYVIRRVTATNVSTTLAVSLVAGGLYSGASKSGTIVVAAAQVYTALTGATKYLDLTLASAATTDILTSAVLYLSLSVAHGSAATADLHLFGDELP